MEISCFHIFLLLYGQIVKKYKIFAWQKAVSVIIVPKHRGGSRDFVKGGIEQKDDFNRPEEAIKNALKWRKPDISSFIIKKLYFLLESLI